MYYTYDKPLYRHHLKTKHISGIIIVLNIIVLHHSEYQCNGELFSMVEKKTLFGKHDYAAYQDSIPNYYIFCTASQFS